jgi:hypothetical protein
MSEDSRAARVLADVLRFVPPPDDDNGQFRVSDGWVDGDSICIVYRGWWHEGTLGLRREIEPGPSISQLVGYILAEELGEPPGSFVEDVSPDARGITWWSGNDPEWRDYDQYG